MNPPRDRINRGGCLTEFALWAEIVSAIARKADDIMWQYFDGEQQREVKSDGSLVTIADMAISTLVIDELAKTFPQDGVVGEEASTVNVHQARLWFCDPIDGTHSYVWGTPTATFSLRLVVGDEPVLGVVYDPFLRRLYTALRGQGSYCNGKWLTVSSGDLSQGIVALTSNIERLVQSPHLRYLLPR